MSATSKLQASLQSKIASLPDEAQKQVLVLVDFLKDSYARSAKTTERNIPILHRTKFVGMWKNRKDLRNSNQWVRQVRKKEW